MQTPLKDRARRLLDPLVELLARARVSPAAVTVAGLGFAAGAGALVAGGRLRAGALCLILSALSDVVDGQLARRAGRAGPFGAFLDSCLDRLGEGAVFLGLALHFGPAGARYVALAIVALIGSTMVSYARARAEGLGLHGQVGVLERPERLALLIVGLLLGGRWLVGILAGLTGLAFLTFGARVRHVGRQVRAAGAGRPARAEKAGAAR